MLRIIKKANEIANYLNKEDKIILNDYKIIIKVNFEIEVFLLVEKYGFVVNSLESFLGKEKNNINIKEVLSSELNSDYVLNWLFKENNDKIDLGLRKRLNNFIEYKDRTKNNPNHPIITTFYSYKGGMGRSTTLAAFAAYCAKIQKKRVVIIDCDFEAPGFTNYFDIEIESINQKSGIVEYLIDKQFLANTTEFLDIKADYSYKVGYEYIGEGEIYIIPAGNLSNTPISEDISDIHRKHYIEALAKLDISSVDNIVNQFEEFIEDINKQIKPDLILFDSRTGFNDIFATISSLSEIIVGFFGNNIQSKIGLEDFLDNFGTISTKKDIFIVNSITNGEEYLEDLRNYVQDYITLNQDNFTVNKNNLISEKQFKIYSVERNDILNKLGTEFAFKKSGASQLYDANFVNLIDKNIFFQPLFDDIFSSILNFNTKKQKVNNSQIQITDISNIDKNKTIELIEKSPDVDIKDLLENSKNKVPTIELRKILLSKLHKNMPSRYGDDDIPKIEEFYIRDCMRDMFNRDKFLVIGSKGTGKTFLYQALKQKSLREKLKSRFKLEDDFLFINLISIHSDKNIDRYLETTQFEIDKIDNTDYFFERFWVVYVWNSLMLDENIRNSHYFSDKIPVEPITQEPKTVIRFKKYILDEEIYSSIFDQLKELDSKLKQDDKNLIILFEQLDFIVKPEYWPKAITPLINFWRSNPFSKILPKLFLRSDLFNKLTGVTNIQNLSSRSIDIEWTKKELFAYFFKIVIQNCRKEFYLLAFAHFEYKNSDFILELEATMQHNNEQVPTEEKYLKPLVEVFFGKYANWDDVLVDIGFGESYDWFAKNLRDGNDKISLRPFLNLIEKSIEIFLNKPYNSKNPKSILSASFYADNTVREFAVKQHFEDLAKEKGNRALLKFYQYITVDGPKHLKITKFKRQEFSLLLNNIFTKYNGDDDMEDVKKHDDLKYILMSNGIIKETDNTNRTYTNYVIPFLYRSYFRVSSQNANESKNN